MNLSYGMATGADVAALASLHESVAEDFTVRYGRRWSSVPRQKTLLYELSRPKFVRILIARKGADVVGTLRLATKKPWAIDTAFFAEVRRPLYLTDMAVIPVLQRKGIGRRLLQEAEAAARAWPRDSIRLDAFDGATGAGPFYAKFGYREVGRATYRKTPLIYFEFLL
jgi:GNAT superfamily N-acetyltransferase